MACRRHIQASSALRRLPYLFDIDLECDIYIQEAGRWVKKVYNDFERDESTEEQLQCNEQYKYTPHSTLSPPILRHGHTP